MRTRACMLCNCCTTSWHQNLVCLYAACWMLQVILQPAVATLQVTTLSLLCFDSTAAYMPVVHAGRMGRVVRTHGLQLHLLRYNINTHAVLSKRRKPRMTYFPSARQLPCAKESSSQTAVNCFHVTWNRVTLLKYILCLCLFPGHVKKGTLCVLKCTQSKCLNIFVYHEKVWEDYSYKHPFILVPVLCFYCGFTESKFPSLFQHFA